MAGNTSTHSLNGVKFIIDSGASHHIINDHKIFEECIDLETRIEFQIAKRGTYIYATKEGTVRIFSNTGKPGILEGVLYCPGSPANLLSGKKFQIAGYQTIFHVDVSISIKGKDNVIIISNTNENISNLKLKLNSRIGRNSGNICNSKSNYNLWHKRLGHISIYKFNELKNKNMIFDSKLIEAIKPNNECCEACICCKQARLPSNNIKDKTHVNRPLLNVHSNI